MRVHPRAAHVGHQSGGLVERELDEPGRHLAASIGWNRNPAGTGITGSFAICRATIRIKSWNWVARSVVHGRPDRR